MKSSTMCLDLQQIQPLLGGDSGGDLSPSEVAAIERHLGECAVCRSAVEAIIGNEHWWNDACASLQVGIHQHRTDDVEHTDSGAVQQLLELLGPTDDPAMLGRIGSYEITGILGRGGMGAVLKGFDNALNRFVAIKVLLPHLAASGAARKRFAREAQAAAAVVDDHVMAIHGVDEWNSIPYFVMPYTRGVSLQKRLHDHGHLELREILRIGTQTAKGLAAAHAQGLVHRDVKPANIFLDEGVDRVQLMDFGLARAVDDASLTRSGVLAGTPQYMSPEQVRAESVDARADLFGLGAVLYAMCTGHAPFRAESSYAVLRLISDQQPRAIREINPDIPDWLCAVIEKLMSKQPKDRYQKAEEVAELLEACLAHVQDPTTVALPISIGPTKAFRLSRKFRRPRLMLLGVVVSGVVLFAMIEATKDKTRKEPAAQPSNGSTAAQVTKIKPGEQPSVRAGLNPTERTPPANAEEAKSEPAKLKAPTRQRYPIGKELDALSPPDIAQELTVPDSAWGPPHKGLQAAYLMGVWAQDADMLYLSGTVVIKNISDKPVTFVNFGGLVAPAFYDDDGEPLRHVHRTGYKHVTWMVDLGDTLTIKRRVVLRPGEQYVLDKMCNLLVVRAHPNGKPASEINSREDWVVIQPGNYRVGCNFALGAAQYMEPNGKMVASFPSDWHGNLTTGKKPISIFKTDDIQSTLPKTPFDSVKDIDWLSDTNASGRRVSVGAGRFQFGLNDGTLGVFDSEANGAHVVSYHVTRDKHLQPRESDLKQLRFGRTVFDSSNHGSLRVYDLCSGGLLQRFDVSQEGRIVRVKLSPSSPLADLQGDWIVDSWWFSAGQNSFNDDRGQRWLLTVSGRRLSARVLLKQKKTADYPASTFTRTPFKYSLRPAKTDDPSLLRVTHDPDWVRFGRYVVADNRLRIVLGNTAPPTEVVATGNVKHFEGHRPETPEDWKLIETINQLDDSRQPDAGTPSD